MGMVWAIVPAAGIGMRVGGKTPKQYLKIGEKTMIEHSLAVLCAHPKIAGVMVALDAADTHWPHLREVNEKPVCVCVGGATRAASVANALDMLLQMGVSSDTFVAVHDAARPCLQLKDLTAVLNAALCDEVGALLAVPVVDTIKRVDAQLRVHETLDRGAIWCAQTPQVFRIGPLNEALTRNPTATDEAQAMELAGWVPKLVPGSVRNLKITRADDFALAAFYLGGG
jgi:2-C-methyl-D-erythritol 4-phosphate cytidylyltransferase